MSIQFAPQNSDTSQPAQTSQPPQDSAADSNSATANVHPVDQRPAWPKLFVLGFQQVLAMYAGAIAVPLIVGGALIAAGTFEAEHLHHLIAADLFVAGIASIIQSIGFWRFGARLPLMQGVSFVAVAPMISIGSQYGVTAIYGSVIATGIFMMLIAPFFAKFVRFFPALVTGTIITIIGLSLTRVAAGWIYNSSAPEAERGAPMNFVLAGLTLLAIILFHNYASRTWRPAAVIFGIILGTLFAQLTGYTNWSSVGDASWFGVPTPFQFGVPAFYGTAIFTMIIVGIVIMIETAGDIIAVGEIVDKPASPKTMANGLRADGLSTFLGGIFNTFPYAAFAQNVGLISLSRVYSRYVVTMAGGILVVLGLVPKLGEVIAAIPAPILGGAGLTLFGMVTASGIKTLATVQWNEQRSLIVAVAISIGLLPSVYPTLYEQLPDSIALIADSGIAMGAIVVLVLNLAFGGATQEVNHVELDAHGNPVVESSTLAGMSAEKATCAHEQHPQRRKNGADS
ncbi:MAG: nucleobase:cation symporter-2 family protein [Corynebacterium sp.]|nr:nucleobase:cation symporter-2 family protein [Corynebacterium sp.]